MGRIGNFGKLITFEVSSKKMLPFKDMKRTVSGRWKQHNIVGKSPKTEFQGADADGVTLTIVLSAEHGVKPRKTLEQLEAAVKAGRVEYLIIGGKKVGKRKMYISELSEEWNCILNKGELVRATVNITFSEYA